MKLRYFTLPFLLLLILACFYYFTQKKDSLLLDRQIVDAVHIPKVNSLFEKADAAKYAQDYRNADTEFKNLLKKSLSAADSQYVMNQLAFINLTTDEDSIANQWIQQLEKTYPLSIEAQADYFYNVGTYASHTFKPKMANDYLQKALALFKKMYGDKHLKTALCLTQLGLMNYQFGKNFIDSTKLYLSLADTIFQSNVSIKAFSAEWALRMSFVAYAQWENEKALLHINNALELLETKNRQKEILFALCISWKSMVVKKDGEMNPELKLLKYHQADSLAKKALEIGKQTNSNKLQEIYTNAILFKSRQKDSLAFKNYLGELNQLLKTQPDYYGKMNRLKGYYYGKMNDTLQSKYYYRLFWESALKDSCRNAVLLAETSINLQAYYNALSSYDSSLYFMKQNIISMTEKQGQDVSWNYLLSPLFYEKNKASIISFPIAINIFNNKYKAQNDLNALNIAYEISRTTDSLIFESLVLANDETLISYQKEYGAKDYALAMQTTFLLYRATKNKEYLEFGFKLSERFKSVLLFRNREDTKVDKGIKELIDRIRFIKSELNIAKDKNRDNQLALIHELEQVYTQLEQRNPDYFKSKILQPSPTLKDIQATLKPTQVLVNFSLTPNKTYRILISKTACDFQSFEGAKVLNPKIYGFRDLITSNKTGLGKTYKTLAIELYNNLLRNIPDSFSEGITVRKSQKELIIVTDNTLALLPFEALVIPNVNTDTTYDKLAYAINNYTFTYTSSYKMYQSNAQSDLPQNPKIAAFTYNPNTNELPYSSKEIDMLQENYGKNLTTFMGSNCTKKIFLKSQNSFDIIHLALHASSNPLNREENKIYFAPKHKEALNDVELNRIQSTVKLLVLSACQTAEGKIEAGEGTYSLSRSFLQSGIPNVIASLWKIDNASSSDILSAFYKQLRINNNPAMDLHQPKLDYLKTTDKQTANPTYWAGLFLNR